MAIHRFRKEHKNPSPHFPNKEPMVDFTNPLDVTRKAKALLRTNDRKKAREILWEGLKNFPRNTYLLNMLMT